MHKNALGKIVAKQDNIMLPRAPCRSFLQRIGRRAEQMWNDTFSTGSFIGDTATVLAPLITVIIIIAGRFGSS